MAIQFTIEKSTLLPALNLIFGAVDRKQAFPILANFLFEITNQTLSVLATDLEIEIKTTLNLKESTENARFTIPAKKIMDILRVLDDQSSPLFSYDNQQVIVKCNRSQFKLSTLSATDFPLSHLSEIKASFRLPKDQFMYLLNTTHFALAQQDVRAYLSGVLLTSSGSTLTAVATDGHRMAMNEIVLPSDAPFQRVLIPKKSIHELLKLLSHVNDDEILIHISDDMIMCITSQYTLQTRLIEANFPPYAKAIPIHNDIYFELSKDLLKRTLTKIAILSNEKSRAILLLLQDGVVTLSTNNQDKEEASDTLEVAISKGGIKIALNVDYLLDVLNYIPDSFIQLSFGSENESILVEVKGSDKFKYIIMPMKLT